MTGDMKDGRNVPAVRASGAGDALRRGTKPAGLRGMVHDFVRTPMGGILLAISLTVSVVGAGSTGLPYVGLAILGVSLAILTAVMVFSRWAEEGERIDEAKRIRQQRLVLARNNYVDWIRTMGPSNYTRGIELVYDAKALVNDQDAGAIAEDMLLRLHDLAVAYEKARAEAGRSDTTAIRNQAKQAVESICTDACARYAELTRQLRARDETRIDDVNRRFAETARAVAGMPHIPQALPPPSASAALQRLIGLAEDALAVDPNLVDSNGGRLDALVREHLPRLLERHAEAARSSASDLATVDAELEAGVEEVRISVAEALERDAQHRFERLHEEVSFLRSRRGA